jgi:hypothetical protein
MNFSKYLVIGADPRSIYRRPTARITDKKPSLKSNEIAIQLSLDIPDTLFQRPALSATIKIDKNLAPETIPANVIDNVKQILTDNLQFSVEVKTIDN